MKCRKGLWAALAGLGLAGVGLGPAAGAQPCEPRWSDEFPHSMVNGTVRVLTTIDSGAGPVLYAGGLFTEASGLPSGCVVSWNGDRWVSVGNNLTTPYYGLSVRDLVEFDDGAGPSLHAVGSFVVRTPSGDVPAKAAKWNGTDWEAIAGAPASTAAAVYDDGDGAVLYVTGDPQHGGHLWRWNGSTWSHVTAAEGGSLHTLTVFDDGGGPALYIGGLFTHMGGVGATGVARWNGTAWHPVGEGLDGRVRKLKVLPENGRSVLYATGSFRIGGVLTHVARWEGKGWEALPGAADGDTIYDIALYARSGGPSLHVMAQTGADGVALRRWTGSVWETVDDRIGGGAYALVPYEADDGTTLLVAGTVGIGGVAEWDGSGWRPMVPGAAWGTRIDALETIREDEGQCLYVAGPFNNIGGVPLRALVRRDRAGWRSLAPAEGSGFSSMFKFDDGGGSRLFGLATFYHGPPIGFERGLYRHHGGDAWELVREFPPQPPEVCVFDDGGGAAVYVASEDEYVRWDGSAWEPLNWSFRGGHGLIGALQVLDDGTGPALYVGGRFEGLNGVDAVGIARWDGQSWSALGAGLGSPDLDFPGLVTEIEVFDDGTGPALYAAGRFDFSGDVRVNSIARWDGTAWRPLAAGPWIGLGPGAAVYAMEVFDDGAGPALFVAGRFTHAGPLLADNIAKWDGRQWHILGEGVNGQVRDMAVFDDGSGPALWVGGDFTRAGGLPSGRIAKWLSCRGTTCAADCDGDGIVTGADWTCFAGLYNAGDAAADCDGSGGLSLGDFVCFRNAFVQGCP